MNLLSILQGPKIYSSGKSEEGLIFPNLSETISLSSLRMWWCVVYEGFDIDNSLVCVSVKYKFHGSKQAKLSKQLK